MTVVAGPVLAKGWMLPAPVGRGTPLEQRIAFNEAMCIDPAGRVRCRDSHTGIGPSDLRDGLFGGCLAQRGLERGQSNRPLHEQPDHRRRAQRPGCVRARATVQPVRARLWRSVQHGLARWCRVRRSFAGLAPLLSLAHALLARHELPRPGMGRRRPGQHAEQTPHRWRHLRQPLPFHPDVSGRCRPDRKLPHPARRRRGPC